MRGCPGSFYIASITHDPTAKTSAARSATNLSDSRCFKSRPRNARARLVERENLLVDFRAWEKAVKLFSSALKDADASARAALCKDPEGEIEKLMEGQTVEKVTGEQAQEDAQQ